MNLNVANTNNNVLNLGVRPAQEAPRAQAAPRSEASTFAKDMQRAADKLKKMGISPDEYEIPENPETDDMLAADGEQAIEATSADTDQAAKLPVTPQPAQADTEDPAILAMLAALMQPVPITAAQLNDQTAQDALLDMQQQGNAVLALADVPVEIEVPAAILSQLAQQFAQDEQANAQTAKPQEAVFAEQILGEINQAVVSNEAERTVNAAQAQQSVQITGEAQANGNDDTHIIKPLHSNPSEGKRAEAAGAAPEHAHATPHAFIQAEVTPDFTLELPDVKNGGTLPQSAAQALSESLVAQVETAVNSDKSELFVQLKPEVLGGLAIKLMMTEDGLVAQLRTSNPAVQAAVHADLLSLEQSLRDKGINVVQMDVIYEHMANNQHLDQQTGRQWQQGQQGSRRVVRIDETSDISYEQYYENMVPADAEQTGIEYSA